MINRCFPAEGVGRGGFYKKGDQCEQERVHIRCSWTTVSKMVDGTGQIGWRKSGLLIQCLQWLYSILRIVHGKEWRST